MQIHDIPISRLHEYGNNPRNNDGAVNAVAESIREFGFKVPIVVDSDNVIVCGHTRVKGARKLGMETVPCIIADDLTPEQIKAFRLADNYVYHGGNRMKSYSVYMHTCPNSKKYIGITCRNPLYRWNHGNGYRRNEHFFRAIVKYGWDNIKHEILFDGLTEEEACAIEVELIAKYKSNDERYGYNKDNGGFTGCKISERTKAKMSDAHKGQIRDAAYRQHIAEAKMCEKNPMYGKCGELHHNSKTVFQKTKNGETIRMFKCVSDAERCLGLPHGAFKNISACALGKKKTAYGFVWCYYE